MGGWLDDCGQEETTTESEGREKSSYLRTPMRALFSKQHVEEGKVGVGRAEGTLPPQGLQLGSEIMMEQPESRRKQRGVCNTQPQCVWSILCFMVGDPHR